MHGSFHIFCSDIEIKTRSGWGSYQACEVFRSGLGENSSNIGQRLHLQFPRNSSINSGMQVAVTWVFCQPLTSSLRGQGLTFASPVTSPHRPLTAKLAFDPHRLEMWPGRRVLQAHITNSRIAWSWVPISHVGGLGKVRVNCFPKATATWHGRESNPRLPDRESDALTTLPRFQTHLSQALDTFSAHHRLCGLGVRHSLGVGDREVRGSILLDRVKPRTLKLVLAADPPSVWHYGFSVKSGRPGVRPGVRGVVYASAPYITVWQHAFNCPKRRL
ncbi:hypothetical protein ElyMa_004141400 [Elysia marginata]|uniref:Uncharacterized protein n=1 Tax=Elysia marginata TaxID=1093978 RepID=A0AAV4GFZ0_9GAST|nr:hypothetical protein ElyMa_004141400 [Elysia marginata]